MTEQERVTHPDDEAVERFAAAMKAKLAKKRAEGRGGWEGSACSQAFLSELLAEHVAKGDPVDVGNIAMMLHQRGESIAALTVTPQEAAKVPETLTLPQLNDACTWYNHGFGLMSSGEQEAMRRDAADWWRSFRRAISEDSHE